MALSSILSITNEENYLLVLILFLLPCAGDSTQGLGDDYQVSVTSCIPALILHYFSDLV